MVYINLHQKVSLFAMSFPLCCLDFDSISQFFSFPALKSSFHLKGFYQGFEAVSEISVKPVFAVIKKSCGLSEGIFNHFVVEFCILCLIEFCLDIT